MKLANYIFICLFPIAIIGATKPITYDTKSGALNIGSASIEKLADRLCRDFYIEVPMTPSPSTVSSPGRQTTVYTWTDFELKVIDKWGNNVYFSSTIYLNNVSVVNGHTEIIDSTPKIFYFTVGDAENGRCYGERRQFTNFNSSIGTELKNKNEYTSMIWLYPSINSTATRRVKNWTGNGVYSGYRNVVWGEYIREIFTNPENLIIVWRQNLRYSEVCEYGGTSQKRWIPVQPIYYGDFKFKK